MITNLLTQKTGHDDNEMYNVKESVNINFSSALA